MKKPLVFSLVRDQSAFMTAIMSLLTFMAVMSLGVAIAIGTGVMRWNAQWELSATVQVMDESNYTDAQKIIDASADEFDSLTEVSQSDMRRMLRPWVSDGGGVLENYLPKMYEVRFKDKASLHAFGDTIKNHARFLTHADALEHATSAGWRMIFISVLILTLVLGAIGVCVSYIARNTAMLHRRELEILNQIGATDSFVSRQMQIIVAKICAAAGVIGFLMAAPMLMLVAATAQSARVGLMAMVGLSGAGWISLALTPLAIIVFAIWITKKTTLKILENN